MKKISIVFLSVLLMGMSACEKKTKPLSPILPSASTKEEFLAAFPQSCESNAKSIRIARVDEEELTPEQLNKGCSCTVEMLGQNDDESQWKGILTASSTKAEPDKETALYLHDLLSRCFEYAVGPQ